MKEMLNRFWKEEEGFGTVELVILIGVLVSLALLFKNQLGAFANRLMGQVFGQNVDPNIPG